MNRVYTIDSVAGFLNSNYGYGSARYGCRVERIEPELNRIVWQYRMMGIKAKYINVVVGIFNLFGSAKTPLRTFCSEYLCSTPKARFLA